MAKENTIARAIEDAQRGRMEQALASLRLLLKVRPDDPDALAAIGLLLVQSGQLQQAIRHLTKAVTGHPHAPGAHTNLANALLGAQRFTEAARHYEQALGLEPAHRNAILGLVIARTRLEDADGALVIADRGLALEPNWPRLQMARALALAAADRVEEAVASTESFLRTHPDLPELRQQMLFLLNYTSRPAPELTALHCEYGRSVSRRGTPARTAADPERPLRVGILSSDLRTHSVGYFAEPCIANVPAGWTIACFATTPVQRDDPMTQRFMALADRWVDAANLDDATLDSAIRDAGIDVLVELNGHSSGNRLAALDRKPAPVIVTAIGYPNTTGHPCVDWRIVDSVTDPPGTESHCTEGLLRLDPCFLCYVPPRDAPAPGMPSPDGALTFGSFNLASKIREETVALWARALSSVPGSRLLLKSRSMQDPALCSRLLARFKRGGIDPARVEAIGYTKDTNSHLGLYSRVHVALDTAPYNGTTTTCEALWMGIPVVTIEGDRHAARVGASLLRAAGLPELVARTPEEFAAIAGSLAQDRGRLDSLRTGLRGRLRESTLLDAAGYSGRFHALLRTAWRAYCRNAA